MPLKFLSRRRGASWATYEDAQRRGRPVVGRVTRATGAGVHLELPGDLSGFVRRADLPASHRAAPRALVETEVEGLVIEVDPKRRRIMVSPRHLAVARCKPAVNKRRKVPVEIRGANRGGLLVEVYGLRGFMPRSELRPRDGVDHGKLIGTSCRAYVIHVSGQQAIVSAFPPGKRKRRTAD
jgi:small subunit ribosomal protein S1